MTQIWRLPPYHYVPLDHSRSVFRLIHLLPPQPSWIPGTNSTLRIEIAEANVAEDLSYDALSYAWCVSPNTLPNRQVIVVTRNGNFALHIHRALEMALLDLFAGGIAKRPLFVDQICINQGDVGEKSHQVQLMRDIYTRCVQTVVWLGPSTRGSDRYFDYVNHLSHEGILSRVMGPRVGHFMSVFDAVMDETIIVKGEEREDRDDILGLIRRYGDDFPLDGFADVLDRRWFNRLWVIQEACLAPLVIFVCGKKSLCFDCFRSGSLFYNIYNTHWVRQLSETVGKWELRRRDAIFDKTGGLRRIFQERKAIHQTGIKQHLYDLVLKYNVNDDQEKIGSTLEEDRIFGLLGLALEDDTSRQRVQVRYKNEVSSIYMEVAALLLEQNIDILNFNQFPKLTGEATPDIKRLPPLWVLDWAMRLNIPFSYSSIKWLVPSTSSPETGVVSLNSQKLPSWVPDWAMRLKIPVGYSSLKEPVYSAGGDKTGARFRFEPNSGQLTIRGMAIDKIEDVGKRTYRPDPHPQVMENVDYRWAKLFFDEISNFVRKAVEVSRHLNTSTLDENALSSICLRVCDSGLSYKHFTRELGEPAGPERLRILHTNIGNLGERLLRSDAFVSSYSLKNIYHTIGITPWYFMPMSEMTTLRLCAIRPVAVARILGDAALDLVTDIVGLFLASARVKFATWYIQFRRRFGRVNLKPNLSITESAGIDTNGNFGPDMNIFTSNLLKNSDRRVFRTKTGLVGMGPPQMIPGDLVAVFHGGTMAHVLRDSQSWGKDAQSYEYLGETYCDGMMDGEAIATENGVETDFILR